jgi:hypothetical protein
VYSEHQLCEQWSAGLRGEPAKGKLSSYDQKTEANLAVLMQELVFSSIHSNSYYLFLISRGSVYIARRTISGRLEFERATELDRLDDVISERHR